MKKKTFDEVRELFESRGFQLLSNEYKGVHSPLEYICSNGHQAKICFSSLQNGIGCAECAGQKKKTIKEVKSEFDKRGFTLLSDTYTNVFSPLEYFCTRGHQTKISFDSLRRGKGCLECSGKRKKTIEEAKQLFTDRGFTLLSTEYKNAHSHLDYCCSKGHNAKISFDNLRVGHGCAECAGQKKKTMEEVRLAFTQRGYKLVSKEYKNSGTALLYICDKGHQSKIILDSLRRGEGCQSCAEYGFNPNKPAILYYLRFQFESNFYYKIGITNRKTSERFNREKISYKVIKETHYLLGKDAHTQEQDILKNFAKYRYKGHSFLTMRGDTELFTKDVLLLDDSVLTIR